MLPELEMKVCVNPPHHIALECLSLSMCQNTAWTSWVRGALKRLKIADKRPLGGLTPNQVLGELFSSMMESSENLGLVPKVLGCRAQYF
jgi:hypothetical protein